MSLSVEIKQGRKLEAEAARQKVFVFSHVPSNLSERSAKRKFVSEF